MSPATMRLEQRVPPFRRLPTGERVMLGLAIAAGEVGGRIESILRDRHPALSHARYNVLRILRGAGDDGLSCKEVGDRLLVSPPDVTRLVDPLVSSGFVTRAPDPTDRRVVLQRLTPSGHRLLGDLAEDLARVYDAIVAGLGPERAEGLVDGCERLLAVADALAGTAEGAR